MHRSTEVPRPSGQEEAALDAVASCEHRPGQLCRESASWKAWILIYGWFGKQGLNEDQMDTVANSLSFYC